MKKLAVLFWSVAFFGIADVCVALEPDGDRGHDLNMIYTAAYPYIKTNGAEVSIITRFMQGERTYETYVQDDRASKAQTSSSRDLPEIGTGKAVERIVPLYISHRRREE